ncbi:MAG: aldo/keto reductase [Planctomycetaceae bacterium]|nr:aldo/keto reductase [Planctomycetaceae bacterium]
MKRRDFLSLATMTAGAATLTPLAGATQSETTPMPDAVEPVWHPLTKDIKTTLIGFGTGMRGWQRRSDLVRAGYPKAIELLRYAYDMGIRHFDLADLYGTHDVVAEALKDKPRDSYILVSKVWLHGDGIPERERLLPEETVRRFLRECRTEYIDIVQIHCMLNDRWVQEYETGMESLAKLKKEGLIRAHGISSHSNAATELAAETDWCDVVHVRINSEGMAMDGRQNDPRTVEEAVRATKKAYEAGKGIIAMKVLGEERMAHDPDMRKRSTKFVMDLNNVHSMIVGFTEKEHISEFVANVAAIKPSALGMLRSLRDRHFSSP